MLSLSVFVSVTLCLCLSLSLFKDIKFTESHMIIYATGGDLALSFGDGRNFSDQNFSISPPDISPKNLFFSDFVLCLASNNSSSRNIGGRMHEPSFPPHI